MHAPCPLLTLATLFSAAFANPVSSSSPSGLSPSPSSSSDPIPSIATTGNLTLATTNGTSKSLTSQKEEAVTTDGAGMCKITASQTYEWDNHRIYLTLIDYSQTSLYVQSCGQDGETMCTWPLLGMGDFLVTFVLPGGDVQFYRQGTVSQDSWYLSNKDNKGYCTTQKWSGYPAIRDWECNFPCQRYGAGYFNPWPIHPAP